MNITNKKSVVTLKGNILWINVADEVEFTFSDYVDIKKAAFQLANRQPVYTLIQLGYATIPDSEVREACTANTGFGFIKAEAFVVNNLGQRIVADHVLKRKRKIMPVRLFTCPQKAQDWLKSIEKRNLN